MDEMVPPRWPLISACIFSLFLLIVLGFEQSHKAAFLDLKTQWVSIAVAPVLIVLIVGGYIRTLKGLGWEITFRPNKKFQSLPEVSPPHPVKQLNALAEGNRAEGGPAAAGAGSANAENEWTADRAREYKRTNELSLVHVYEPSIHRGMKYDITVFLVRHKKGPEENQRAGFEDVDEVDFYFGPSWGNEVFKFKNNGGAIGIRTSAWGTFLATAHVIFKPDENGVTKRETLYRYIDFEMAPDVSGKRVTFS